MLARKECDLGGKDVSYQNERLKIEETGQARRQMKSVHLMSIWFSSITHDLCIGTDHASK